MASLLEKNLNSVVSKQTVYNVRAKIKKTRMEGRNIVEELLHQCNTRGYRCYWRYCEENNVLNDIVVAHSVSILMMRICHFVLIIDTTRHIDRNNTGKLTLKIGKDRAGLFVNTT
ncbi:hypothetical protein M9H77_13512 [Catharanthus roseus]|uniref:Uncharacterized protein n=1 Tax=Catharanthus roseus TaxID=4058 RepID=A0ACC0BKL7_CATRO|nr:hypothetical protein M9H77_13512 [Catharanthus roseus]